MRFRTESSGGGFTTITISKINLGDQIYAEERTLFLSSGIYDEKLNPTGGLRRNLISPEELAGVDYTPRKRYTRLGRIAERSRIDERQTTARKNSGERPYIIYKAIKDGQKATFKSRFPGSVLVWDARPLGPFELYTKKGVPIKSYKNDNPAYRPHGTLIAVKGAFLVGDLKARSTVYTTGQDEIRQFSGTKDSFQKFSGDGIVCLEAPGSMEEVPLYPGESVACWPGNLLAFTEGIKLKMISAGDSSLRKQENNDFLILATAGEKGGFFYGKSVVPKAFFDHHIKKK